MSIVGERPNVVAWRVSKVAKVTRNSKVTKAAKESFTVRGVRDVRVGVLGLGQIGQAVTRLADGNARLTQAGWRFTIASALVRDVARERRCPRPALVTSDLAAFLHGSYDVVIEVLGVVEPARTIVARLLARGIPVVTANKALVAAHGDVLARLAARHGTSFRYEASALAGVPFLGALAARPLFSDITSFAAVVNGTSNFVLSALESADCSFDEAVGRAQSLGLTEPDPSRDLEGLDAADKLRLLSTLVGWGALGAAPIDVHGIRDISAADLAAARQLGATIKPIVSASHDGAALNVFVGPALVPLDHPLAALRGTLSGIQLSSRHVPNLFFSGPGAGPEITAATILDDTVEAVSSTPRAISDRPAHPSLPVKSPATGWFIRARFPGVPPACDALIVAVSSVGLVPHAAAAHRDAQWVRVGTATRAQITLALEQLQHRHRLQCLAIRAL